MQVFVADAFAPAPFRGNPAAVCLVPRDAEGFSDGRCQTIAREMNHSETTFVEVRVEHLCTAGPAGNSILARNSAVPRVYDRPRRLSH
jgi:hypothetical protein